MARSDPQGRALFLPEQFDREGPLQVSLDGAVLSHADEKAALRVAALLGQMDMHAQFFDLARPLLGHDFFHPCAGAADVPLPAFCRDAHDREHTGAQRRGQQIGGGKALPEAVMIGWGVGVKRASGRTMHGFAVQVAGVAAINGGHHPTRRSVSSFGRRQGTGRL